MQKVTSFYKREAPELYTAMVGERDKVSLVGLVGLRVRVCADGSISMLDCCRATLPYVLLKSEVLSGGVGRPCMGNDPGAYGSPSSMLCLHCLNQIPAAPPPPPPPSLQHLTSQQQWDVCEDGCQLN